MATELVEPTGTAVAESQIQSGVAATASTSPDAGSAAMSLKDAMQQLSPAKPEPSAAQKAGDQPEAPVAAELAPKEPVAKPDFIANVSDGALESFRGGLKQARRDNQRSIDTPAETETAPEENPESVQEKQAVAVATDDTPVTDEEIQKTINDPAISKRHQKRMVHLANQTKDLKEKLAALEAKPQTNATDEKIKAIEDEKNNIAEELIKYRRRYSLESDPELKRYDEIAGKAEDSIYGKLKEAGITDATVSMIKDMGGFDGFSRSSHTFTINVKDVDGEIVEQKITASNLAKKWLNDMNMGDSEYIRAKLAERFNAVDAKRSKAREMEEDSSNWFKQQTESYKNSVSAQEKAASDYRDGYRKLGEEWEKGQDWMKDKAVSSATTEEEKAYAESHNKAISDARNLFKAGLAPTSLEEHVSIVKEAASAKYYRLESERLSKELSAAKQQLDRARGGVSTTGKPGGGSISRAPAKRPDNSAQTQLQTSAADSLREALESMRESRE